MDERKSFDQNEDLLSLTLLQPFVPKDQYFPYTSSSLSYQSIRIIVNDIVLNGFSSILELGSGLSSIIFHNALKALGSENSKLVSVDENLEWIKFMRSLSPDIDFRYAAVSNRSDSWYQMNEAGLKGLKFDLIIVDGPSAWQEVRKNSRAGIRDYVRKNQLLEQSFSIYIDDCNRTSEKQLLSDWATELGIKPEMLTSSLGRISKGGTFNTI